MGRAGRCACAAGSDARRRRPGLGEGVVVAIVMGLDQHRAQITAEWIDTETGEVSRGRITPADRQGVVRFLERFASGARGGVKRRRRGGGSWSRSCAGSVLRFISRSR